MKSIIFDMDGVLIDSERHWKKAELGFFNKLLPEWTKEDQQKIIGINVHDTYRILKTDYGLAIDEDTFISQVKKIALTIYREKASLLPGVIDLLMDIKQRDIPTALASSSLTEWIESVLQRFGLRHYFKFLISAENLDEKGKPAPDIYLHTAKRLGVEPKQCVVIEDSRHGVMAAKSAGMMCIGLRNGFNNPQDLSSADMELKGFTPENSQIILNWFKHD